MVATTAFVVLGTFVMGLQTVVFAPSFPNDAVYPEAIEELKVEKPDPATTTTNTSDADIKDMSHVTIDDSTVLGDINAPVTIIEFSDFQCPFCKRLHEQVSPLVTTEYINTGKVRFIYKNYAFLGSTSVKAAQGLWCAHDQDKYWEYHDYVFETLGGKYGEWMSDQNMEQISEDLQMDANTFETCMQDEKYKTKVEEELAEGQELGVTGTPSTYINGEYVPGAQPYDVFEEVIKRKLEES